MTGRIVFLFLALFIALIVADGQEASYGPGYQTILINNPAFTGSEGDGTLRLSYINFYPGHNFNLQSVYVSFDSYIDAMHGGAGFFLADDYQGGIINDLRGGVSYAYHLQVNEKTFVNAGLAASFYYRGLNNSKVILPDQIDPLNGIISPSGEIISERGRGVFDIGTGIMIMSERIIAAVALDHLASPDLTGSGLQRDRLGRKLVVNLAGSFDLDKNLQILVRPVLFAGYQSHNLSGGAGASLENSSFSISAIILSDNAKDIDLQAGFSIKKGKCLIFYNYKFNITSDNRMLPVSLMHQAGLALSLHYVDKRKPLKTINFPKL
jgi:type IX secretion system PorP/SprF family membrane protein